MWKPTLAVASSEGPCNSKTEITAIHPVVAPPFYTPQDTCTDYRVQSAEYTCTEYMRKRKWKLLQEQREAQQKELEAELQAQREKEAIARLAAAAEFAAQRKAMPWRTRESRRFA